MGEYFWEATSTSPENTLLWGEVLGKQLRSGDTIALEGDLGAGKTVLTKGIARGLGIESRITSPTFTLINEYRLDGTIFYHVDCYRLGGSVNSTAEGISIGLPDILNGENIVVVEWAGKVKALLPHAYLWIELHHAGENSRKLLVKGIGRRGAELAEKWLQSLEAMK